MSDAIETQSRVEAALPVIKADEARIATIKQQIIIDDRASITAFGDGAQRRVTDFADRILEQTRSKDLGETGELLTDILVRAQGLDPASLRKPGFFERLFTSTKQRLTKFSLQFEDVAGQIDAIVIEMDKRKEGFRKDIALLDDLHEETRGAIMELDAHIEAGKAFVDQFRTGDLAQMAEAAKNAEGSADGLMAAQRYQDAAQALERLEKRVFYLQQARTIGIQQLPQIRIVQAGDETLIENLQATSQLTIPVWKQKMVLLLGLNRQEEALALQKSVTDATKVMLKQASEMMKEQAIEIERQAQRGVVDMETLETTNRDLIDTIQGVLQTQQDGRQKRTEAESRMQEMTGELKTALTEAVALKDASNA